MPILQGFCGSRAVNPPYIGPRSRRFIQPVSNGASVCQAV
jgi:hypothetical protein